MSTSMSCSWAWDLGLVGCEYRVIFADTLGSIEREEVAGPVVEGMKSQMKEEVVEGRMLAWMGPGSKKADSRSALLKKQPSPACCIQESPEQWQEG